MQRFHQVGDRRRFRGVLRVTRGPSLAARVLAPLLRLPPAAEAEEVTLEITRTPGGERWERRFGRRRLASEQWAAPDGLLAERLGPFQLRFRLAVEDGSLTYRLVACDLGFGRLRLPLPRSLAPLGRAREAAAPNPVPAGDPPTGGAAAAPGGRAPAAIAVDVRLSLASGALLVAYAGLMAPEEEPP